jgi:hypothetical protein
VNTTIHLCQRWRERRDTYRPAGEPFDPRAFEVTEIEGDREAKTFVERHHYSGSYPAARFRFGLYRCGGELAGVSVFSHPCRPEVLTSVFPGNPLDAAELGRFVLLDDVKANAETWFLARCFELLRGRLRGVVSFSDPFPRTTLDGRVTFKGHLGTIYQASNAVYLGQGKRATLRLLPDGRVLSARAISKIRALERGWRYSAALLEGFGAEQLTGDPAAWLREWLPRLTRNVRHPGNHRYAFALWRPVRRVLPASLPYPKLLIAA